MPPPGTLEVSLRGSGALGTVLTVDVTGGLPFEKVTIARGMNGIGVGPCLAPLGDQCLGMLPEIQVFGRVWTDGDGMASVGMPLPGSAIHEGSEWCAQAIAVRTGGLDAELSTVGCATLGLDSDGDGVVDPLDVCDGGDDTVDPDGDGVPTDCDPCPLDPSDDSDGDGVCDGDDLCPGSPDIDADLDGTVACLDCDDTDALRNPDATETCNGVDDDCDLLIDEADSDVVGASTWFADQDGDGFGDPGFTVLACTMPSGFVDNNEDCNDLSDTINPGAEELCGDGVDQDCDGFDPPCAGVDADGDGFDETLDCDDENPLVNPAAVEVCNDGRDDDCDAVADDLDPSTDPATMTTWFFDADFDNYGAAGGPTLLACAQPLGYADNDFDCDDTNDEINPGAFDVCGDGVDQDCDLFDPVCETDMYDGLFALDEPFFYSCALGLVTIDIHELLFSDDGTLVVTGLPLAPTEMIQDPTPEGVEFTVVGEVGGACLETYVIEGTFFDDDTWAGLFTATYDGGFLDCLDCTDQTEFVSATRL